MNLYYLFIIEFVNSISILLVYEVFRNVIRVLNIPKIHTTKNRHLKQLQLFQISMAKDTGPKTALFGWPPKGLPGRLWDLILGCWTWLVNFCLWASWQTARYHCGRWGLFSMGQKRNACMMRCPKWFFWRPCSWPGKLLPFRCCFSSDEYCIASCFMWASQPSSRHSSRHHLACKNLACFLPFNHFSLRFFWHKNRPLNTAFNPNSIQKPVWGND